MDGAHMDASVVPSGLVFEGTIDAQQKLIEAIAAARLEFGDIDKDRTGQYGNQRFKYATLGLLVAATAKPLADRGVVVMQNFVSCADPSRQRLTTTIMGHGARITSSIEFSPREAKEDGTNRSFEWIKEYGKLRTYLRRYEYQTLFLLDAEPDADEAGMPTERREEPRREAPRPEPRPEPRQRQARKEERKEEPRQETLPASPPPPPPESKPLSFDKPMQREEPPRDEMAEKLSTVAEPKVELDEDGPTDEDMLGKLLELQRALGMGRIQLAQTCEKDWGIPPGSIRQSRRAAQKVLEHMQAMVTERLQGDIASGAA